MNSFKKMLEEDEKKYADTPAEMESGLRGSIRTVRYAGDVTDLYLSKIFGVLIGFAGGNPTSISSRDRKDKVPDGPGGPGGGQ